jgi:hypothetical protein
MEDVDPHRCETRPPCLVMRRQLRRLMGSIALVLEVSLLGSESWYNELSICFSEAVDSSMVESFVSELDR